MNTQQPIVDVPHASSTPTTAKLKQGRHRGFVIEANGRFRIDRRKKVSSIVPNEIILHYMVRFLDAHYGQQRTGTMLDVGAGLKPYAPVYEPYFSRCVSVDVPHSQHDIQVDYIGSAEALPFEDSQFDCVLCTEVLEHCADPDAALREMHRVLKPGGRVFLTTPFLVALHEMPYDFYRYTPSALAEMSNAAQLDLESIATKGDYFAVVLSYITFPITKFWQLVASKLKLKVYRPANPFVFLGVVAPQLLYMMYWRMSSRSPRSLIGRVYKQLDYITLGYVTSLSAPVNRAMATAEYPGAGDVDDSR